MFKIKENYQRYKKIVNSSNLDELYEKAGNKDKREIIDSMYLYTLVLSDSFIKRPAQ